MQSSLVFLGFIVGVEGVRVDDTKVKAVKKWLLQKIVGKVRSFFKLDVFYKQFIRNFSVVSAPMTKCMKKKKFV